MGATEVFWAYDLLKEVAAKQVIEARDLEELKELFSEEIGSIRRRECIRTVSDLIDCLERRDIISEYNVAPLHELAENCSGQELQKALDSYVAPKEITAAESVNQYNEQRLADNVREHLKISGSLTTSQSKSETIHSNAKSSCPASLASSLSQTTLNATAYTERKRIAIYKLLAQELGTYWRRFGRELQVGEGAMDDIELKFPRDTTSRVHKLLQIFEEDECHDPKQNIQIIIRALDECKRKDLRREVENILSY